VQNCGLFCIEYSVWGALLMCEQGRDIGSHEGPGNPWLADSPYILGKDMVNLLAQEFYI